MKESYELILSELRKSTKPENFYSKPLKQNCLIYGHANLAFTES
ncbi:hypothetical protein FEM08_34240 [Flavobacterium gilvum]|nr:hypothetical protein FEM08_34240 [Flavobacterium gilvum]